MHPSNGSTRGASQRLRATIISSAPRTGTDLGRVIDRLTDRSEALPFELAAHVAAELARAVAETPPGRNAREIHLDNVIIEPDGHVSLIPCRLGPVWDHAPHLAPECRALGAYSAAADVYALGVLLHAMLAGERPTFRTRVPVDHLECEDVPAFLVDLVARATHPAADQRIDNPDAFADALHAWLDGQPASANADVLAELLARHDLMGAGDRSRSSKMTPGFDTASESSDSHAESLDTDADSTNTDSAPDDAPDAVADEPRLDPTLGIESRGRWAWLVLVLLSIILVAGMMRAAEEPAPVEAVQEEN